ncbi:MAG: LPS assembly protein LptD, partial [Candidatus Omnitrophica bacterium]|nr:LPS assembly protein LptD [Candidatus Omnitrophota bacterium]
EIQFSNLKKLFPGPSDELDAIRLDTNHTLSYAGHIGALSVVPRVGTRQTFYSRDAKGERDLVRATFDPGMDVSVKFFKTYDFYLHAAGLDINRIRHIFTPTASYNYRPNPTVARTVLQQFDAIDALDKQNFIRWNFENKFQTKERGSGGVLQPREIARIIPFFDTDLHTGRLDNVGIDAELRPYPWMGIETDAAYNTRTGKVETANADFYLTRGKFYFAVGHRYVHEESTQTTAEIRMALAPDWEIKVYDRYEFDEGASKEFEVTVSKVIRDCIIVDVTYNRRDGDAIFVVFRLKGFPKASFGLSQSYRRPKAPAAASVRG